MSVHYLIIGNGAAGLSAAEIIRKRDARGRITIISNERHLFYSRPGIAYVIAGQVSAEQIVSRNQSFYREHNFDLPFGTVTAIDPLRQLIDHSVDVGAYEAALLPGDSSRLPHALLQAWRDWHEEWEERQEPGQ